MTNHKEIALNEALDRIYGMGFGLEPDDLETYFSEKLMILGTTVDEKFLTIDGLRKMIRHQKEQSVGMDISFTRSEVFRDFPAGGDVAIVVEDVFMKILTNGEIIELDIRTSLVLEYKDSWKLIHWHASKPELVESEVDTFGVAELKQKTLTLEKLVAERTTDLIEKNKELEMAVLNLKATQSQLIQSEKMASLGELTAGIAHEIQNPLNFVNNFSDVSIELLDEMEVESRKSNVERDDNLISEIHHDIKQNLEKISHHGKRADSIVKGMLQHSRATSGQKELTDINLLIDEYLRLAYHGLRAKDKSFNAKLITSFDENLPKAAIISQDVGRVLLNLFTNAFYAAQKRKQSEGENFDPIVEVATSVKNNFIEIGVKDNGGGIPSEIIDKIFQPFFTTKPTGEGTGLGLSLAYDIVKAHGGKINVESNIRAGTEFRILLAIPNP